MKRSLIWALGLFACVVFSSHAQDVSGAKQRMIDRLPEIVRLLAGKTIGENNSGFVEKLGKIAEADAKVVEAENADRKVIYDGVAKKMGQSVSDVGTARALVIASKAKAGTMLQDKDGKWAEKK